MAHRRQGLAQERMKGSARCPYVRAGPQPSRSRFPKLLARVRGQAPKNARREKCPHSVAATLRSLAAVLPFVRDPAGNADNVGGSLHSRPAIPTLPSPADALLFMLRLWVSFWLTLGARLRGRLPRAGRPRLRGDRAHSSSPTPPASRGSTGLPSARLGRPWCSQARSSRSCASNGPRSAACQARVHPPRRTRGRAGASLPSRRVLHLRLDCLDAS